MFDFQIRYNQNRNGLQEAYSQKLLDQRNKFNERHEKIQEMDNEKEKEEIERRIKKYEKFVSNYNNITFNIVLCNEKQ